MSWNDHLLPLFLSSQYKNVLSFFLELCTSQLILISNKQSFSQLITRTYTLLLWFNMPEIKSKRIQCVENLVEWHTVRKLESIRGSECVLPLISSQDSFSHWSLIYILSCYGLLWCVYICDMIFHYMYKLVQLCMNLFESLLLLIYILYVTFSW